VGLGKLFRMPESSVLPTAIYQLRVVLCDVSPLVWRRLLVLKETRRTPLAGPMGFRIWAALFCGKMPNGYRFPVFVCIVASVSVILQTAFDWSGEHLHHFLIHEYDFTTNWKLDIRLERALPFDPDRVLPSCIGGNRAAPPEDCAGALDYLKRLDWHRSHLPIGELNVIAEAVQRFLDSDGNGYAIGDLAELHEAVDCLEAYQDFQPDRFDRRELNHQLRTLAQDREVRL
jgi:Plasmid pRiA4b ORF-3-like protein